MMKVIGLSVLLCAETAVALTTGSSPVVEKRQILPPGLITALGKGDSTILGALGNGRYGRQSTNPAGAAPLKTTTKSDINVPGAKRVKIRTGPYLVPGMNRQNSWSKHWGMLESHYDVKVEKPCTECNILRQVGGLEYADGRNANIDSNLWLHHMVHFVAGPKRWDAVAYNVASCLPHEGVNSMGGSSLGRGNINAKSSERYFVTGNERLPFHYYHAGKEGVNSTAFHLESADRFFYLVELMNMNMNDATVYITMTYDIIDGPLPSGWMDVKSVFLDANSCASSEVPSPRGQRKFTIPSVPWRSNVEGRIIDSIGHLHDGGVEIEVKVDGKNFCVSTPVYSGKAEYVYRETSMAMHGDKVAKDHISDMTGCGLSDIRVPRMTIGSTWKLEGHYDYDKRAPNSEAGNPSEVMAIAIVLVAVPLNLPRPR